MFLNLESDYVVTVPSLYPLCEQITHIQEDVTFSVKNKNVL